MAKRSKTPKRAEILEAERCALARTLKRCKVDTLRAAGVKSARPAFPDLSCAKPNVAPLSQCKGGNGYKRTKTIAVPDGFHIGNPHKQGLQLMPNREAEWSGGRKS